MTRLAARGEIEAVLDGIALYIEATMTPERDDRLWPAHFGVFPSNPLNIAYGAYGIAAFLQRIRGEVPTPAREWIVCKTLTVDDIPPGLFVGAAGIAYQAAELGMAQQASEAIGVCFESPLLFADPSYFLGVAGWGLVSLYMFQATGLPEYRQRVSDACLHLMRTAVEEQGTLSWTRNKGQETHFGFGYGSSGIALFLASAGQLLGEVDLLHAAEMSLEYDIANRRESSHGWSWPDRVGANVSLPYWGHGGSGVGTSAIRLGLWCNNPRFVDVARTLADHTFCKWSILPSQVEGLAGIGDYMLDMFLFTGDEEYLHRASEVAKTIMWYTIQKPEGVAFPGRWLDRISVDYATGSAGIGLFLHRLLYLGPRFLVDLIVDRSRLVDSDILVGRRLAVVP